MNKIIKFPTPEVTVEQNGSYTIRGKALANVRRVAKKLEISESMASEYLMATGLPLVVLNHLNKEKTIDGNMLQGLTGNIDLAVKTAFRAGMESAANTAMRTLKKNRKAS